MAVKIGSARIDENGHISGGKAGDQTGNEVGTQNYYVHSKGWRVFRAIEPSARDKIATAMERACANNNIGYDQNERSDLYNQVKTRDFDPGKATSKTETDCSALVRVCCAYAGIMLSDFNTATEPSRLSNSGKFKELTGSKYTSQSAYLCRGDILVTKTKGHTVVVLTSGSKSEDDAPVEPIELGDRILSNGDSGSDVKELQGYLIQLGYDCGTWGADGDFGDGTELAVKKFQKDHGCYVDGEYGPESHIALMAEISKNPGEAKYVQIVGGNCYVRSEPNTSGEIYGIATSETKLPYAGETSPDGWLKVKYIANQEGWVSGKYGRLVNA